MDRPCLLTLGQNCQVVFFFFIWAQYWIFIFTGFHTSFISHLLLSNNFLPPVASSHFCFLLFSISKLKFFITRFLIRVLYCDLSHEQSCWRQLQAAKRNDHIYFLIRSHRHLSVSLVFLVKYVIKKLYVTSHSKAWLLCGPTVLRNSHFCCAS